MKKSIIIISLIILVLVSIKYIYFFSKRCGVLPKDANYNIILGNELYNLTRRGLKMYGRLDVEVWHMKHRSGDFIFDKNRRALYFHGYKYDQKAPHSSELEHDEGIYKMDLTNLTEKPTLIKSIFPPRAGMIYQLSPDGKLLLFLRYTPTDEEHFTCNTLMLLNLETGEPQKVIIDDFESWWQTYINNIVWINSHQFVYLSTKFKGVNNSYHIILATMDPSKTFLNEFPRIKKISKELGKDELPVIIKHGEGYTKIFTLYYPKYGEGTMEIGSIPNRLLRLLPFDKKPVVVTCSDPEIIDMLTEHDPNRKHLVFMYDVNTKIKVNLGLDGYYPAALSPDGDELLMTGNGHTILYNIYNKSIREIAAREMLVERAVWLPDGSGFLYSDSTLEELLDSIVYPEGHLGLYYYSLEKKKSIRLSKYFYLNNEGGFVLPPGIDIKLPDTEVNRKIHEGKFNTNLIKIYN